MSEQWKKIMKYTWLCSDYDGGWMVDMVWCVCIGNRIQVWWISNIRAKSFHRKQRSLSHSYYCIFINRWYFSAHWRWLFKLIHIAKRCCTRLQRHGNVQKCQRKQLNNQKGLTDETIHQQNLSVATFLWPQIVLITILYLRCFSTKYYYVFSIYIIVYIYISLAIPKILVVFLRKHCIALIRVLWRFALPEYILWLNLFIRDRCLFITSTYIYINFNGWRNFVAATHWCVNNHLMFEQLHYANADCLPECTWPQINISRHSIFYLFMK